MEVAVVVPAFTLPLPPLPRDLGQTPRPACGSGLSWHRIRAGLPPLGTCPAALAFAAAPCPLPDPSVAGRAWGPFPRTLPAGPAWPRRDAEPWGLEAVVLAALRLPDALRCQTAPPGQPWGGHGAPTLVSSASLPGPLPPLPREALAQGPYRQSPPRGLGTPPLRRPPGSERENQGLGRIRDPGAHCQEACLPACPGSGGSLTIAKRLPCARLAL